MGFHGDHHHRLRNGNPSLKRLKRSHLGNQMVVLCFVLKDDNLLTSIRSKPRDDFIDSNPWFL